MPQTRGDMKVDKSGVGSHVPEDLINTICSTFASKLTSKIEEVEARLMRMDNKLDKLDDINTKFVQLNESVISLTTTVTSNSSAIKKLDARLNLYEQHAKRNSLRFYGLEESNGEKLPDVISTFISKTLLVSCSATDLNFAYRVGNFSSNPKQPRPIIVNFVNNWKRSEVFASRKNLKKSDMNVTIFEDLVKDTYITLKAVKEKFGKDKAWTSGGRIYFLKDGKRTLYNPDN